MEQLTRARWYFYLGLASMFAGWFLLDLQDSFPDQPILFYSGALFGMGITSSIVFGPRLLVKKEEGKLKVKPFQIKDKQAFKEKVIILTILGVLFMPVRLIFYELISKEPISSIGMVSLIGISFIILAEKNKIGKIGRMWKKHMYGLVHGRLGRMYMFITLFLIPFLILHVYWLDQAQHSFFDERQKVFASILVGSEQAAGRGDIDAQTFLADLYKTNVILPDDQTMAWAHSMTETQRGRVIVDTLGDPMKLMPFFLGITNEATNGWIGHIVIVALVGEMEGIALFFIYRKVYSTPIETSLHESEPDL